MRRDLALHDHKMTLPVLAFEKYCPWVSKIAQATWPHLVTVEGGYPAQAEIKMDRVGAVNIALNRNLISESELDAACDMNKHDPELESAHRPRQGFVHIVDDDASFLTAIERGLMHAGYEVATYASAQHLLDRLPSEGVPSCILLEVKMPGLDGPALQSRLSELGSTLPIIFLTGHPDIPTTVRTIKAGADDFLTKPVSSTELLHAVERAIAHHEVTFGLKSKLDMVRARIATLTPREREVFELVIRGNTNKQAACALGCTERTIKAHRHEVMAKMQVQSLAELVSVAERSGVVASATRQTV
jgi:FixJ family two-component response regulator